MPTRNRLRWTIEESPTAVILRFHGGVDMESAPEFTRVVRDVLTAGHPTLIDLTGVEYFDSHGIDVLKDEVSLQSNVRVKPSRIVRKLLALHYLSDRFNLIE